MRIFIMYDVLYVLCLNLCIGNQVRNLGYGNKTCLDSPARKTDLNKPAGLYPCHKMGGNQVGICLVYWHRGLLKDCRGRVGIQRINISYARSSSAHPLHNRFSCYSQEYNDTTFISLLFHKGITFITTLYIYMFIYT